MTGKFFRNVAYMSAGNFFSLFIALVSTAIFIRVIGTSGYAIIGISASLFGLITYLDINHYLCLVRYNHEGSKDGKKSYEKMFNTLFSSILFSNALFVIVLLPLVIFLSKVVYNEPDLILFYIFSILTFLFIRINRFLANLARAKSKEKVVQNALVASLMMQFVLSLLLLFIFQFGVLSIFIGVFAAKVLEFLMLFNSSKKLVRFQPYFSYKLFLRAFKDYTGPQYLLNILIGLMLYGGFFLSTIYLNVSSLGVLTIFFSLGNKLKLLFVPFKRHILPVYSNAMARGDNRKIGNIINNTTFLFLVFFSLSLVFLFTIGKYLFLVYYGSMMQGTYYAFLLIISGLCFWSSFVAIQIYFFVSNIRLLIRIFAFLIPPFFVILFILANYQGLIGVTMAYFGLYLALSIVSLYFANRSTITRLNKANWWHISAGLILMALMLIIYSKDVFFQPLYSLFAFVGISILILLLTYRKLLDTLRYTIFSM